MDQVPNNYEVSHKKKTKTQICEKLAKKKTTNEKLAPTTEAVLVHGYQTFVVCESQESSVSYRCQAAHF